MSKPSLPQADLRPGHPIPMMDEQAHYAAEMEAEAVLTQRHLHPTTRLALLRLLMAYREVRYGKPLTMPEKGAPGKRASSTWQALCGEGSAP